MTALSLAAATVTEAQPALGIPVSPTVSSPQGAVVEGGYEAYRNLAYGPLTKRANLLDVYLPGGAREASQPLPVVVFVHGGGWAGGDKGSAPAALLTRAGYAVVGINYRYSHEAPFPAQIYDCKGAVRWVRAHAKEFNLDASRIAVWGDSAGAHLASLLGTTGGDSSLEGNVGGNLEFAGPVQAVCDWFGPADFRTIRADFSRQFPGQPYMAAELAERLLGGQEESAVARTASPAAHVSAAGPPFLIIHGDRDPVVPVAQSRALAAALRKAGVQAEFVTIPGAGHGGPAFQSAANLARCVAFFDRTLRTAEK